MTLDLSTETPLTPNWRHVGIFLALNFGLTYLLDLAIYLRGGLKITGIVPTLQFQMLLPAFSAVLLGMFFFPESPIFLRRAAGRGRWFYYFFLLVTAIYSLGTLLLWLSPAQSKLPVWAVIPQLLAFLVLLILIVLRLVAGREAIAG